MKTCIYIETTHISLYDVVLFTQDGYWIGVKENSSLIYSTTVPGFLNCTQQGALPGCEIKYDSLQEQCAQGREGESCIPLSCQILPYTHMCIFVSMNTYIIQGKLCGECKDGYGVTFDLRFCRHCGAGGIVLFVFICELTPQTYMYVCYN